MTFDTPVEVDTAGGTPRLRFRLANAGGTTPANKNLDYVSASGTAPLTFEYAVQSGDSDTSGISIGNSCLQANGGAITHATTGRTARLNHNALGNLPGHKVNGNLTPVSSTWNLIPTGLGVGDSFRLLFLSSNGVAASHTGIAPYNSFVQNRAKAGHAGIQAYSDGFRVVGCTDSTHARYNTRTTYTSTKKGVTIYWLNGNEATDDYEDFYDGDWDDEVNDKDQFGNDGPDTGYSSNYPWTGCDHDGTKANTRALGDTAPRVGRPNSSTTGNGPIGGVTTESEIFNRPMYGLSSVFRIVDLGVGVTVSKTTLTVTEEDATGDSYTAVLNSQPMNNVTVTVAGYTGTDVTLTPSSGALTFTRMNWDTPQTVTVNWTAVYSATGYNVQWKSGDEGYNNSNRRFVVDSGSTTSHTIPNLTNGTEYTIRVIATRTGANWRARSNGTRRAAWSRVYGG